MTMLAQNEMLTAEILVGYDNAHVEEVDGDLVGGVVEQMLPTMLVAMGVVDHQECQRTALQPCRICASLGGGFVALLETPYHILVAVVRRLGHMSGKHLGVKVVDER